MKLLMKFLCSSLTTILDHLSGFNLKDFRVNSWRNSILGSRASLSSSISRIWDQTQFKLIRLGLRLKKINSFTVKVEADLSLNNQSYCKSIHLESKFVQINTLESKLIKIQNFRLKVIAIQSFSDEIKHKWIYLVPMLSQINTFNIKVNAIHSTFAQLEFHPLLINFNTNQSI